MESHDLAWWLMVGLVAVVVFLVAVLVVSSLWRQWRCPHPLSRRRGIYGDEIIARNFRRAECMDCGKLFDRLPMNPTVRPWRMAGTRRAA